MEKKEYKTFDELPMFLSVAMLSNVLGISSSLGYELMHEEGFPSIKIGGRIVIPRDKLISWLEERTAC